MAESLPGELLTIWTVRLAVACYVIRYLADAGFGAGSRRTRTRTARLFWTSGCVLYLAHVVCAFAFFHGWSHRQAYAHTAAQTKAVIGWDWGGGLYVNYLFTLLWVVDVLLWWRRGDSDGIRPRIVQRAVDLFMAFVVFNATVVFGPPIWKWIAAGVLPAAALLFWRRRSRGNVIADETK